MRWSLSAKSWIPLIFCLMFALPLQLVQAQDLPDTSDDFEPFDIPLPDLEKEALPVTTLEEQCRRFMPHYRYYCKTSNIAKYNEEIRIICERYVVYCSDRIQPTVNHIRRQQVAWAHAGVPKSGVRALAKCYESCRETDPVCVNACECIHLQWSFSQECNPGASANALPNCQRWQNKCKLLWKPLPDFTPADRGIFSPFPIVRGVFYGYDGLGNYRTFTGPRDHGVSYWRGTNTVLVDWPEGKLSQASTFDVPFAGVNGIFNAVDIGLPNIRRALKDFTRENPDPLNPGTGRRRHSAMAALRRQK